MSNLISEQDFLAWEEAIRADFPERAIYYDPRIERVYLLYYEVKNGLMADEYVMSEGVDNNDNEILFKFSVTEKGDFRNVTNLIEFHERATELTNMPNPHMN